MKVLIVEDEQPAFCNLAEELHVIDEKIDVVAGCSSVEETVRWLHENPHPDLILMDVQLSDGLSFSIFKNCKITCPVIFTTAYNEYLSEAFRFSSIDYLLKPISASRLADAIQKYKSLRAHFVGAFSRKPTNRSTTITTTNSYRCLILSQGPTAKDPVSSSVRAPNSRPCASKTPAIFSPNTN